MYGTLCEYSYWSDRTQLTNRIQPNPTTQQHQLALWTELVLAWAKHDRVFSVNADSPEPGDVFNNKTIGRECVSPAFPVTRLPSSSSGVCLPPLIYAWNHLLSL